MQQLKTEKEVLLKKIIDQYLNSRDFNGLPIYQLTNKEVELCKVLLVEDKIELYSDSFVPNPHIKSTMLNKNLDKTMYLDEIKSDRHVVFYPTESTMRTVTMDEEKPFTLMLMKGKCQLEIVYFKVEVLEAYFQDPRYSVSTHDYRGNIYAKDEYYKQLEGEWLKNYGLAYHNKLKNNRRAIGVFIGDLAKMSLNAQLKWKINLLSNQEEFTINPGFIKNLIYGEWVDEVSIYSALLDEMNLINNMCDKMGIPQLFKKSFDAHGTEKPEDYRIIILPTLKNYYAFITSLEKIVVDNINYKTFLKDGNFVHPIERNKENGNPKGSLMLFQDWLERNISTDNDIVMQIIKPLKEVRKIRQNPAHRIYDNTYDIDVYRLQNDLINETYTAIRNIRLYFQNHPYCKDIEIPEYLITGEKIVVY